MHLYSSFFPGKTNLLYNIEEKESAKHAASDTSDNIKSTVAETESKSEKDSEGFVGRLFQMFSSVKTSLLGML